MKKVRPVVARNSRDLAKVLGLQPADGMEIEFRSDLNDKIIEVVGKKGLTHSDVARLAHTSRTGPLHSSSIGLKSIPEPTRYREVVLTSLPTIFASAPGVFLDSLKRFSEYLIT